MDLAEHIQRLLRSSAQTLAIGDIDLDEMGGVIALEDLSRLGEMLLVPVGHDDLHALGQKVACHAEANAAGAAGYERNLACKILHPVLSSFRFCRVRGETESMASQ